MGQSGTRNTERQFYSVGSRLVVVPPMPIRRTRKVKLDTIAPRKSEESEMKLTLQRGLRLGFNSGAITRLDLNSARKNAKLMVDRDDKTPLVYYMQLVPSGTPDSFPVTKAGKYYYIRAKSFFDQVEAPLPESDRRIIFDLEEVPYHGTILLKMKGRFAKGRVKKPEEGGQGDLPY